MYTIDRLNLIGIHLPHENWPQQYPLHYSNTHTHIRGIKSTRKSEFKLKRKWSERKTLEEREAFT